MKKNIVLLTIICCFINSMQSMEHHAGLLKTLPKGAQHYLNTLPTIDMQSKEPIARQISTLFTQHSDNSKFINREHLIKVFQEKIDNKQEILFIMPSFPAKSPNTEKKTISSHVDLAEFLSLATLNNIGKQIKRIYQPGGKVILFPHEPFLEEMNKTSRRLTGQPFFQDNAVKDYQSQLKQLVSNFPYVAIFDMPDANKRYTKYKSLRTTESPELQHYISFMRQEVTQARIKNNIVATLFQEQKNPLQKIFEKKSEHIKNKYKTLIADKTFETIQANTQARTFFNKYILPTLGLKKRTTELATQLAHNAHDGAQRVRKFMEHEIPNYSSYIRASIHGGKNKFGLACILGSRGTPWHKALAVDSKSIMLTDRQKVKNFPIKYYHYSSMPLAYVDTTKKS